MSRVKEFWQFFGRIFVLWFAPIRMIQSESHALRRDQENSGQAKQPSKSVGTSVGQKESQCSESTYSARVLAKAARLRCPKV